MEPHPPLPGAASSIAASTRREQELAGRDEAPLCEAWLEREALHYVARWEATRRGVEANLERKIAKRCERSGEDADPILAAVPAVVARLVERNYVNDRRFGEQLVTRLRRQGRSLQKIRAQLEAKGVPEALALELTDAGDPAAETDAEVDAAFRLARRRRIGPYCPNASQRLANRERHLAILGRQGFSLETAVCVIDAESPPEKT
ncbi:MAG: hypothetical protein CL908_18500 [Deltaproteobacteria bacterium]|nr:hypothetical protein [Deltaproteobacteria bacterium]